MKKVIMFIIILSLNLFGTEVHPKISLDNLYKTAIFEETYPKQSLSFVSKNQIEIRVLNKKGKELYNLDKYPKEAKILSVFFEDVSGEGIKELFILWNFKGKNRISVYFLNNPYVSYVENENNFVKSKYLEDLLNKRLPTKRSVDATSVKKELENLLPINYSLYNFNQWENIAEIFHRDKFDVFQGKITAYYNVKDEKILNVNKARYYYLEYGKGLYGLFIKDDIFGFYLDTIFEAYEKDGKLINNGKAYSVFSEEEIEINYKDGVKHGYYGHYFYDGEITGNYIEGKKEGRWVEEEFSGNYENDKKTGIWINEKQGIKEYYDKGLIKKKEIWQGNKLKAIKNYGEKIVEEIYDEISRVEKKATYSQNEIAEEVLNFGSFRKSPIKSYFYDYDLSKGEFIGDFTLDENQKYKGSRVLELNEKGVKLKNNLWGNQFKLFSIKEKDKEIFILMERYPQGFAINPDTYIHFGVREVFEGRKLREEIENFGDIVRDGVTESFSLNYYKDQNGEISHLENKAYYKNGLREGLWETYFYPSILWSTTNYKDGKKHGLYRGYDVDTGKVETEGYYENDIKIGNWKYPEPFFIFGG